MRTIKFRGKVKGSDKNPDGLWVYGFPYQENDEWFILYDFAGAFGNGRMQKNEVIKETVEQFTGLTDKNGKEIFEGDIIMVRKYNNSKGVVVFLDGTFMIEYKYIKREFSEYALVAFEVIGNIYDNPDLLNQ